MAAARTKNRRRNPVRTRSKAISTYKELGVEELQWPAEDERELSQEIIRVNPLNRHSILQAPSHKFVVSHWGRTSSLVAKLTSTGQPSNRGSWKSSSVREGCYDCSQNRQGNITAIQSDKPTTNYWRSLSDEIILAIFQLLPKKAIVKCAHVCKHWHRLAYDESLWRCVDMTKANLPSGLLGKVLKRGTRVLRLAQAKVASPLYHDDNSSFPDIVPLSPESPSNSMFSLRYLDATCCSFESDTLFSLIMHSKQLTHLSLESCAISVRILKAISEFRNLTVLNLAMCTGLTVTGMCSLVKSGGKNSWLKELNLAWTNLSKATILHVIKNLPKLQQLNLSGCRDTLTDDCVKQLVKSCPNLTHLDLSDAFNLTGKSLEQILKLGKLVKLSLSRCYSIAPAAFSLCSQSKSLKSLEIFGFLNTEGIDVLKKELPRININKSLFSSIARPVGSLYFGRIWDIQCKD